MKKSIKAIFSFGVVSGIVTTIGLITGLVQSGAELPVIIGGILTISFADAFSDALGLYYSSKRQDDGSNYWSPILQIFFIKLIVSSTFLIPMIIAPIKIGLIISIIWSLGLLSILSYYVAIYENEKPWKSILKHVSVSIAVILITFYIGNVINNRLN